MCGALDSSSLVVERVEGRWPHSPRPLKPEHIEATVSSVDGERMRIRLDDMDNPEAWLELVLRKNAVPGPTSNGGSEHDE